LFRRGCDGINGLRRITPIFKKYGWLKRYTGILTLTKTEANEEALCFDWIDNLVQSIDDKRYMQKFTPRKINSIWPELNKKL